MILNKNKVHMKRAENIMSDGEDKYLLGWGMQILGVGWTGLYVGVGQQPLDKGGGVPSSPHSSQPCLPNNKKLSL